MWIQFLAPNALDIKANGGQIAFLGNSAADYHGYYINGSDTNLYGGWRCYAVDPRQTPSITAGAPTVSNGSVQAYGCGAVLINNVFKGNPIALDAVRVGRCTLTVVDGDATTPANFLDMSVYNDTNDPVTGTYNRFGLFQYNNGTYIQQGKIEMGTAATPCYFEDFNRGIVIQDNEFVDVNFNTFEINNASSVVKWTGISITSTNTVSPGALVINNNPIVELSACTFTGMGAFTFDTNTTIAGTAFSQCGLLTQNGASITGCTISDTTAPSAIINPDFTTFTNNTFVSGGDFHGVELTVAGSYAFNNLTFSGYGADETTAAAVYNNSGGDITITVIQGSVPTVRNSPGSTTTVISGALVTLTGLKSDSEVRAYVGTNPATAVELAGTESSGTSFQFAHNVGGQDGFITIFHLQYQAIYLSVTYSTSDSSFPIQQILDRQYI